MIYVGENKSILCKGDFHPAQLYKGDKKIAGYSLEEFSGEGGIALENCYNDRLHNAVIHGNSIQDGTPTPEAPIEVQSVGELVTEGEYAGKYRIGIIARSANSVFPPKNFDIYLEEPLRKIGEYEDYIDFEKGVIVRNVGKKVFDGTETFTTYAKCLRCATKDKSNNFLSAQINCLSNFFEAKTWEILWTNTKKEDGALTVGVARSAEHIICSPYSTLPTIAEWKAQLAAWYEEGNPFTVWYAVLTTEEAIKLPKIPTFKGTIIYEVDTSITAKIEGRYKKQEVK